MEPDGIPGRAGMIQLGIFPILQFHVWRPWPLDDAAGQGPEQLVLAGRRREMVDFVLSGGSAPAVTKGARGALSGAGVDHGEQEKCPHTAGCGKRREQHGAGLIIPL